MTEHATGNISVTASPERCYAIASDLEHYVDWVDDIKEISIDEKDANGRPTLVTFRAAAFGRSTNYTLRYSFDEAPRMLSWTLVRGDITTKLDGCYMFDAGDAGGTNISYVLDADFKVPIPGFIKMRAQSRIMTTALRDLKGRVEREG